MPSEIGVRRRTTEVAAKQIVRAASVTETGICRAASERIDVATVTGNMEGNDANHNRASLLGH